MSKFRCLKNTYVNADRIDEFFRCADEPEYLTIVLHDGRDIRVHDPRHYYENTVLPGSNLVKQVIPATKTIYVVYATEDENGEMFYEVRKCEYLALCEDGNVYPLTCNGGYLEIDDVSPVYDEYSYPIWKSFVECKVVECFGGK